jgi:hypothetical protein
MRDISQEAETICNANVLMPLDHNQETCVEMARMVPHLVAEIKHIQADNEFLHKFVDAPGSTLEAALNEIRLLLDAIEKQQNTFGAAIETAGKTLAAKDIELARWQKIAIDLKAKNIQEANSGDFVDAQGEYMFRIADIGKCQEQAAKELNLQLTQETGYVERLEKDYAKLWRMCYGDPKQDDATRVQAALNKIREGKP